ncbi:MAG TPA: zinc ribbon domain-containing protein, partial [Polyangiaceae bacterium]|nr:zinc ribbon domain-containing protein [Polyangiaceae bacterium]
KRDDAAESLKRETNGEQQPAPSAATAAQKQAPSAAKEPASPCPGCGGANDADAKFCKHCGATLDGPRPTRPASAREEKAQ